MSDIHDITSDTHEYNMYNIRYESIVPSEGRAAAHENLSSMIAHVKVLPYHTSHSSHDRILSHVIEDSSMVVRSINTSVMRRIVENELRNCSSFRSIVRNYTEYPYHCDYRLTLYDGSHVCVMVA